MKHNFSLIIRYFLCAILVKPLLLISDPFVSLPHSHFKHLMHLIQPIINVAPHQPHKSLHHQFFFLKGCDFRCGLVNALFGEGLFRRLWGLRFWYRWGWLLKILISMNAKWFNMFDDWGYRILRSNFTRLTFLEISQLLFHWFIFLNSNIWRIKLRIINAREGINISYTILLVWDLVWSSCRIRLAHQRFKKGFF